MDPKSVLEGMFSSVAEPWIGQFCGSLFQFFFSSKLQAEEQCNGMETNVMKQDYDQNNSNFCGSPI